MVLLPGSAYAHLVETRCGPFYDGFCHSFVTPTDLLIVLAISLLAGFAGPAGGRTTLFALTLSWIGGAIIGATCLDRTLPIPVAALAGTSLAVGLLVASNWRSPRRVLELLALSIGFGMGLSNGAEFSAVSDGPLALVGNGTCLFVVTSWMTALAVKHDTGWQRIVVRVAGSWIAAVSLLMIGWEFRK